MELQVTLFIFVISINHRKPHSLTSSIHDPVMPVTEHIGVVERVAGDGRVHESEGIFLQFLDEAFIRPEHGQVVH